METKNEYRKLSSKEYFYLKNKFENETIETIKKIEEKIEINVFRVQQKEIKRITLDDLLRNC
ncbi:hypothetical protein N5U26_01240 [Aliarcobacter cryaerophilus]|uniref:hypothetical protein n=1 Tax=Aliarcobacter cryaerophilus TaxID=28198 RepID=UPI0021B5B54A|nr:hypothetical protein [Aliarcobacter cryaerophilus]MCT7508974.1 hypothetical protein [Aliarcobacter cryaerophilus]